MAGEWQVSVGKWWPGGRQVAGGWQSEGGGRLKVLWAVIIIVKLPGLMGDKFLKVVVTAT